MNVECGMLNVEMTRPRDIQERAFAFACEIVRLQKELARSGGVDRALTSQMLRSGTSIGANLAEAKAGQSKPDFIPKTSIALKEARETLYWLRLLSETEATYAQRIRPVMTEADEIVSILTTIVKKASNNKARG
jgi:four helix bundle protein